MGEFYMEVPTPAATVETGEPVTIQTPATLPADFLTGGFLDVAPTGRPYLKRIYVQDYAREIAALLAPLKSSTFASSFLRDVKRADKRSTPLGEKLSVVAMLEPRAIKLTVKNKAPAVLLDWVQSVTDAVTDDASYCALLNHIDAVHSYMIKREGGDN